MTEWCIAARAAFGDDGSLDDYARGLAWSQALLNLGACLRDAGALCAAFEQGYRYHPDAEDVEATWEPGIALDRKGAGE